MVRCRKHDPYRGSIADHLQPIYENTEAWYPCHDLTQFSAETVDAIIASASQAVAEARADIGADVVRSQIDGGSRLLSEGRE